MPKRFSIDGSMIDTANPAAVLGQRGGKMKSNAKAEAARKNAKLGGWPKGKPRKTDHACAR